MVNATMLPFVIYLVMKRVMENGNASAVDSDNDEDSDANETDNENNDDSYETNIPEKMSK
eukprot:13436167-Ditylum_brightwellii.AAC.2